jgi:hypothetical protein
MQLLYKKIMDQKRRKIEENKFPDLDDENRLYGEYILSSDSEPEPEGLPFHKKAYFDVLKGIKNPTKEAKKQANKVIKGVNAAIIASDAVKESYKNLQIAHNIRDPKVQRDHDKKSVSYFPEEKQLTALFTNGQQIIDTGIYQALLQKKADGETTVFDKMLEEAETLSNAQTNTNPKFKLINNFLDLDSKNKILIIVITTLEGDGQRRVTKIIPIARYDVLSTIPRDDDPGTVDIVMDNAFFSYEKVGSKFVAIPTNAEDILNLNALKKLGNAFKIQEIVDKFRFTETEDPITGEITRTPIWDENIANELARVAILNFAVKPIAQEQTSVTLMAPNNTIALYEYIIDTQLGETLATMLKKTDISNQPISMIAEYSFEENYPKNLKKFLAQIAPLVGIPPSAAHIADQKRLARIDKAQRHLTGISISKKNQEEAIQLQDPHKKEAADTAAADTEAPKRNPFLEALDARRKAEAKAKEDEELGGSLKKTKTKKKRSKRHKKTKKHMNKKTNKRRKHRSNKSKKKR